MRVMLVGSPGRFPFAGYFRGRATGSWGEFHWAGRVQHSGSVEAAWAGSTAASTALGSLRETDRFAWIDAAWAALRPLDRGDLSLLMVSVDPNGTAVAACGLAELRTEWGPVVEPGHPLLADPGIPERTGYFHATQAATCWAGLPVGGKWPSGDLDAACGWRG